MYKFVLFLLCFCFLGCSSQNQTKTNDSKSVLSDRNLSSEAKEDIVTESELMEALASEDKAIQEKAIEELILKENLAEADKALNEMDSENGRKPVPNPQALAKQNEKIELEQKDQTEVKTIKNENEDIVKTEKVILSTSKEEIVKNKKAPKEEIKKVLITGKPEKEIKTSPAKETFNHDVWNVMLNKFVNVNGGVNYSAWLPEIEQLDTYLAQLMKNPVESSWSKNKQLAYWINAYNAFTVKMILDNYPLKSIMDLHGGKPWDKKWIKIGGKTFSLNNIENDIIRPTFNEPRIHFAVNCAARSCPPLLNKAWTEKNIALNFEKQTKSFINNSTHNTITSNEAKLSKIFDWYGKDFGDLRSFINKYGEQKINPKTKIKFKDYDWALNAQ